MYTISRGYNGRTLTAAQRSSSRFAEEPLVMGRVMRRGTKPFTITEEQYQQYKPQLTQLEKHGSILVKKVEEKKKKPVIKKVDPELGELVKATAELEKGLPAVASRPSVKTEETTRLDSSVSKVETAPVSPLVPESPQETKKDQQQKGKGKKEG